MIEVVNSIVFFIVAIGVLITFHEYGHFWVARKMGVTVVRFSIGFGPAIWKHTPKDSSTEYRIAAIPLGGYVKMLDGNIDELDDESRPFAYDTQPLYKRSAIVAAGPLANFLLAALLYGAVFAIGTEGIRPIVGEVVSGSLAEVSGFMPGDELRKVDGRTNESWEQHHFHILNNIVSGSSIDYEVSNQGVERTVTVDFSKLGQVDLNSESLESLIGIYPKMPLVQAIVGEVVDGYPAQAAGMQPGDRITSINGEAVRSWADLVGFVSNSTQSSLLVGLQRDGEPVEVMLEPKTVEIDGRQVRQIGIKVNPELQISNSEHIVIVRHNPVEAIIRGFQTMWSTTALTVKMLFSLLKFEQSADAIGGPIAIADYAGKAAQAGINNFLTFLALLSISLGLLNLLPIPVLDGGHLMFHLYEAVFRSPPTERMLVWANQVGFALLIGLMGLAFYNDISRMF
ncbi:MAG: RIP metalloprotease RseP [Acidiferrobacterales bacterium]|nr:RIP metalloprotease RseP [Acidiferrobacterales bacterium]